MHYALHIIQVLTQRFHFTSEPNLNWKMARTSGSETVLVITSRLPRHMHSWKLLQLSRKTFAAVVFFSENQVWDLFSTQNIQHHRTKTCHSLANDQSHIFSFYLFFIIVKYLIAFCLCVPMKKKNCLRKHKCWTNKLISRSFNKVNPHWKKVFTATEMKGPICDAKTKTNPCKKYWSWSMFSDSLENGVYRLCGW